MFSLFFLDDIILQIQLFSSSAAPASARIAKNQHGTCPLKKKKKS